jgi:hypothetical protein
VADRLKNPLDVPKYKRKKWWRARKMIDGSHFFLGCFETEEEARKAERDFEQRMNGANSPL